MKNTPEIKLSILLVIVLAWALSSCKKYSSIEEYVRFINDPENELVQTNSSNGIRVTCAYKPAELLAYQEIGSNAGGADSASNQYKSNVYVTLSFSRNNQEIENAFLHSEAMHAACLSYLTHHVYEDVSLCTATDTVPATASTYSRQYGANRASTVLVVFAKGRTDVSGGFDVLYRGGKFNMSTLRFPFTAEALHGIPALRP